MQSGSQCHQSVHACLSLASRSRQAAFCAALLLPLLTGAAQGPQVAKPTPLTYVAPVNTELGNRLVLKVNGGLVDLLDDRTGALLLRQRLAETSGAVILGADGDTNDTLIVDLSGGPIPLADGIRYDGGVGGFDTLIVRGGGAEHIAYSQRNPNDGSIDIDGLHIEYTNIEPIIDTAAAATYTINILASGTDISALDGGAGQTTVSGTGFESITFSNKTAVTINAAGGGSNIFTLNNPNPATGMTTLNLNGGSGNDSFVVLAAPSGVIVNIDGGGGINSLEVDGIPGTLDNLRYVPTAARAGKVYDDNFAAQKVDSFAHIDTLSLVLQSADNDGVRIDGTVGNDDFVFTHGGSAGTGTFTGTMDKNNATGGGPFALIPMSFSGANPAANDLDVNFFVPGGSDSFTLVAPNNDNSIVVGPGEAGGIGVSLTSTGALLWSRFELFNLAAVYLQGGSANDQFLVMPQNIPIDVNGALPNPPASPGDTIQIDLSGGATGLALTLSQGVTGYYGSYSFSNRAAVSFSRIEGGSPIFPGPTATSIPTLGYWTLALLALAIVLSVPAMRKR